MGAPNVVALLSFFDETPDYLWRYVEGLRTAGIGRLVALDGGYSRFPDARPVSSPVSVEQLQTACRLHGIDLTLRTPATTWVGDEVAKRTALYRLADSVSVDGEDWYLVLDADEWIVEAGNLELALLAREDDRATVSIRQRMDPDHHTDGDAVTTYTRLLRAHHGIRVEGKHWLNVMPDGFQYRLDRTSKDEPSVPLFVDHMTRHRSEGRRHRSGVYYTLRDEGQWEQ